MARLSRVGARGAHICTRAAHSSSSSSLVEKRNSNYALLGDSHATFFERIVGASGCVTAASDLAAYNSDWLRTHRGQSKLVLLPRSTEQVSAILAYCHKHRLAVCPQGGNTGLVCGGVPIFDEIVLSAKLMNEIRQLDADSHVLTCQSGCILQQLDEHVAERANLMMPLDLGAKGSCHIGGNVSTNAGGLRLMRYGSLKQNVLGLEVVLADGTVLDSTRSALRKDNTGYDLKQLFVGAEGTLGFVTSVSMLCPVRPASAQLIFMACTPSPSDDTRSFRNVLDLFKMAKRELAEILSAFEFMDAEAMRSVNENLKLANPFSQAADGHDARFYCLAETHGSCAEHDMSKLEAFYDKASAAGLCTDAVLAENAGQFAQLWSIRERLAESSNQDGYFYNYDVSLPLANIYELVEVMRRRLADTAYKRCIGYGHLGDGNLHLNVTSSAYDAHIERRIEPFVYEWTRAHNGSISAEHGIGHVKRNYLHMSKSGEQIFAMKRIKAMLDPHNILNPYKVFPL